MGRLLKYRTKEEKNEAQRQWSRNYYYKNKKNIDDKSKRKYWMDKFKKEGLL